MRLDDKKGYPMFTLFHMAGFDLFILFCLSFLFPFFLRFMRFLVLEDARGNLGRILGTCAACLFLGAAILSLTHVFQDIAFLSPEDMRWATGAGFLTGLIVLVLCGRFLRHITRTEPHEFY